MRLFPLAVADDQIPSMKIIRDYLNDKVDDWKIQLEASALGLNEEMLLRPFKTLSNGERTKMMLAAFFLRENRFFLIDEPTNHLDREGREQVASYLNEKRVYSGFPRQEFYRPVRGPYHVHKNAVGIDIQKGNFFHLAWEQKAPG
jgi:lincosamide and streptogramin A transport system ATP-binding/permease protein